MKKCFLLVALFSLFLSGLKANEWKRVYLTSFPRSGNHWVRALIEEATHVITSSVYRDKGHDHKIWPWGGYCPPPGSLRSPSIAEVVVIKTHYPSARRRGSICDHKPYVRAIRIVRHPVDTFYSLHVFQHERNNKTPTPLPPIATDHISGFILRWKCFQNYWNQKKNVVTVRYEDLFADPQRYLRKILDVLGYPYTDGDIARAVTLYPPSGSLLKHANKFSSDQLVLIQEKLAPLLKQFNYTVPIQDMQDRKN